MEVFIVLWVVYAVIFGGFCAYLAEEKDRNGGQWFILGFLFGIISLLALIGVPSKESKEKAAIDQNFDIDRYIMRAPPAHQEMMIRIRYLIHTTIPDINESIEHNIPVFKRNGNILAAFASRKKHVALFCPSGTMDRHRNKLGRMYSG